MQEAENRKTYIMNDPISIYSQEYVVKETEKKVRAGDKEIIVVQKRHKPTNRKWITVVGYVIEQIEFNENEAYFVQPISDEKELELLRPFLEADESLEKKLEIFPHWVRFKRI